VHDIDSNKAVGSFKEAWESVKENVGVNIRFHDATLTVTHCGRICFHGRKVNLSHAFAARMSA